MKSIYWNQATWYSKLGAIIFFIGIFPIIAFNLGRQYEKTINVIEAINSIDTVEIVSNNQN